MDFEQISFDGASVALPTWSVRYKQLDTDHRIYSKIDWLTTMFFNCSINDVLAWINLEDCVADFMQGFYESDRALDRNFNFVYNGVRVEVPNELIGLDIEESIFTRCCPRIRLELSGSALDYLRSIGTDMDFHCKDVPELPEGADYHFTRVDYAFDFVNYHADFVDRVIAHCNTHSLPSGRVPICHQPSGVSFSVRTGSEKTVYLGSRQSDKMLRIYDKKMEQMDLNTMTWKKVNPFGNPESWFRIEWQMRNKVAHSYVVSSLSHLEILKHIFDTYAFADGTVNSHSRVPVPFWKDLFNWEDIRTSIIQNANWVQLKTPEEKVYDSFKNIMLRTFMLFYSVYGVQGIQDLCTKYCEGLYNPQDPTSFKRNECFRNKVNELAGSMVVDEDSNGIYRNSEGHFAFRMKELE